MAAPDCPLCYVPLSEDLVATECGHVYHKECMDSSMRYRPQCPSCRKPLNRSSPYTPLFFCLGAAPPQSEETANLVRRVAEVTSDLSRAGEMIKSLTAACTVERANGDAVRNSLAEAYAELSCSQRELKAAQRNVAKIEKQLQEMEHVQEDRRLLDELGKGNATLESLLQRDKPERIIRMLHTTLQQKSEDLAKFGARLAAQNEIVEELEMRLQRFDRERFVPGPRKNPFRAARDAIHRTAPATTTTTTTTSSAARRKDLESPLDDDDDDASKRRRIDDAIAEFLKGGDPLQDAAKKPTIVSALRATASVRPATSNKPTTSTSTSTTNVTNTSVTTTTSSSTPRGAAIVMQAPPKTKPQLAHFSLLTSRLSNSTSSKPSTLIREGPDGFGGIARVLAHRTQNRA